MNIFSNKNEYTEKCNAGASHLLSTGCTYSLLLEKLQKLRHELVKAKQLLALN